MTLPEVTMSIRRTVYVVNGRRLEVRIREKKVVGSGKITYPLVTKFGAAGVKRQETPKINADREEFEFYLKEGKPITGDDHWEVPLPSGQKLEIKRFTFPLTALGLILAEIEFDDEEAARSFKETDLPPWLQPLVIKDVTDDGRYNAKSIAVDGRPDPE